MASILVVEDYPSQQFVYQKALTHAGHKVDVAADGDIALDLAKKHNYDLILLDMLLGRVSGMDFLERFKPKQHPNTRIIVLSNVANPETMKETLALGATRYFTKANFTPEQVLDNVNEVLGSKTS